MGDAGGGWKVKRGKTKTKKEEREKYHRRKTDFPKVE